MKFLESFSEFNPLNEGIYDAFKDRENLPEILSAEEGKELVEEGKYNFKFFEYIITIDKEKKTMLIVKPTPKARYSTFKTVQYYRYHTMERMFEALDEFIKREQSWLKRKEDERQLKQKRRSELKNPYKIGDIFYDSWGYEQTNIDFYQVTNVTDKSVYLREIAAEIVPGTEGHDSANVKPVKDKFIGEEFRKPLVVTSWSETPRLSSKHGVLSPYTAGDSGVYKSWYY